MPREGFSPEKRPVFAVQTHYSAAIIATLTSIQGDIICSLA
jgi:hypothetical protein